MANRTSYPKLNLKNGLTEYQRRWSKEVRVIKCHKISEVKIHPLKIIFSQDLKPDNILKIFLNFTKSSLIILIKFILKKRDAFDSLSYFFRFKDSELEFHNFSRVQLPNRSFTYKWRNFRYEAKTVGKLLC